MKQTPLYKTAVILHALKIFGVALVWPVVFKNLFTSGPLADAPQVMIIASIILGVAGLVSAYGAWQGLKWGVWLTLVLEAWDGAGALPGILFAPNMFIRTVALVTALISLFVIVVLLRRPKMTLSA